MRIHAWSTARVVGLTLVAVLALPAVIRAIYVAPTAVFIDHRTRSAEVIIGNSSDQPEEATVELQFGFVDVDSAGRPFVRLIPDPDPQFPSAADWIRPFPQRVRLEPGTHQVVRLLARPPEDLPDGEYWTRLLINGSAAFVRLPSADTALRAGLNVSVRLVVPVTYRKGEVSTQAVVRGLTAEAVGDSLVLWAHLAREGNAAYLGTADVEVVDTAGSVLIQWSTPLAVYYPVRRRLSRPLDSLAPGDYWVRLRLRTERPDLPPEHLLGSPTVVDSVGLRVF